MTSTDASAGPPVGTPSTGRRGAGADDRAAEAVRDELISRAKLAAPEVATLIDLYYRDVPPEEITADEPRDLAGRVSAHRGLAESRMPGRSLVRLCNPTVTDDGWTAPATVVQVVTDDMPYLVDSVVPELRRLGVAVLGLAHPIVVVRRGSAGALAEVLTGADPAEPPEGAIAESWMYLETARVTDADRATEIETRVASVLGDVREVIEDTTTMVATARSVAGELRRRPTPTGEAELADAAALLDWLADGHFTFLGYRRYEPMTGETGGPPTSRAVPASGLGVLRSDSLAARALMAGPDALPPDAAPLILTQAGGPSAVHRSSRPYYVGVRVLGAGGALEAEHRFLGLLTTTARHENVLDIPVISRRVREAIHRAGFPLDSYSGERMLEVAQTYPRAELFSTDPDTLYEITTGVLGLTGRRKAKLFLRPDPYGRFVSALVYLPRDRYTTGARQAMQDVLLAELSGTDLEYSVRVGETEFAQVHFMVYTGPSENSPAAEPDRDRIQALLEGAARSWDDTIADYLTGSADHDGGHPRVDGSTPEAQTRVAAAFPEAYKEDFTAADGLADLHALESLAAEGTAEGLDLSLYVPDGAEPGERRFKLYLIGERVTLSAVLPVLARMGVEVVDERPYGITLAEGSSAWIFDFGLRIEPDALEGGVEGREDDLRVRFSEAFAAAWRGDTEVDGFNALVLRSGLSWRQVSVLRAYAKYLRQVGTNFSQDYIEDAMLAHTDVAGALLCLFEAKFDASVPAEQRAQLGESRTAELEEMIDEVASLDSDRILRSFLTLITATVRTNYPVRGADDALRPYLAFKLAPQRIPELPEPRPAFEIFVYSARFEGVHLRFGAVARGGLRWSDRREDFRTEILGLAKAQAVKNAVIVPVGAKGGFVLKRPPAPTGDPGLDREALQAEGVACYRTFIAAMLELTDNLSGSDGAREVIPAQCGVRYDGDDPYLVVAADKGTASFSDIANEVAIAHGYWLGDAFASGGSVGYDHKAMGITARGAWESVRRHFRELGLDTQESEFTVAGIGDMSGDVFGNGMLCSPHIRLVAAFDHRHIFLDPDPDAAASYAERRRMFGLPRSSWADYDRAVISAGGGVWPRSAKSVPVSPAARAALGLSGETTTLPPNALISAILRAPVDLLWNGGIGTYVKASTETQAQAGDRANDQIRVDGAELRARVVGEGGNLGVTQRGRIEVNRCGGPDGTGGKINTDALDNSAGVDCSDHEVNIKILLDHLVAGGTLDVPARNALLGEMTDEVGALVLADNRAQNTALGVSRAHARAMVSVHGRLVADLEATTGLDRELEALPSTPGFEELERDGIGLSSPELATLLAHVKLALKGELLASDLPDTDVFARRIVEYFPPELADRFPEAIREHRLHREIISTLLVNEVVDGGGISYAFRLAEETSAAATDAVRAFVAATRIFELSALWARITDLQGQVSTSVTDHMMLESRRLLDRAARWLLSNRPQPLAVGAEINRFAEPIRALAGKELGLLHGRERHAAEERAGELAGRGVPAELAETMAVLLGTYGLLDVIEVAELAERDAGFEGDDPGTETAQLYFALSEHLGVDEMLTAVSVLDRGDRWHALARLALRDDFYAALRAITLDVLRHSEPGEPPETKIAHWEQANASRLHRARTALAEIATTDRYDLATLSVAARQVRSMVR